MLPACMRCKLYLFTTWRLCGSQVAVTDHACLLGRGHVWALNGRNSAFETCAQSANSAQLQRLYVLVYLIDIKVLNYQRFQ